MVDLIVIDHRELVDREYINIHIKAVIRKMHDLVPVIEPMQPVLIGKEIECLRATEPTVALYFDPKFILRRDLGYLKWEIELIVESVDDMLLYIVNLLLIVGN